MRSAEYRFDLKPSVDYLERCGVLLLDTRMMAVFLGVPHPVLRRFLYTDRIPLPLKLGMGRCIRWNLIELLEWVHAGCPHRSRWIEMRGSSGWYPLWR